MAILTTKRLAETLLPPQRALAKDPVLPDEPIWQMSVAQYHAMIGAGILTENDPIELLEGLLVLKMPKNPPHSLTTELIREALRTLLPDGWHLRSQEPITTADSEPEPDVFVVRGVRRQFADRYPGADDIALVIEVAEATLRRDRGKSVFGKVLTRWRVASNEF